MPSQSQWDIEELNKGARAEGFKSWSDLKNRVMDSVKKQTISGNFEENKI